MSDTINDKHDTTSYENCSYPREIFDGNLLYESFLKAKQGSSWKPSVQKFDFIYLLHLAELHKQLSTQTYHFHATHDFVLNERGKTRCVSGECLNDRIVKHALCDEYLTPATSKYLIYDNGASQVGKGVDFARRRLETHLHKYYNKYHTNEGYVLLIDFAKYYDNIQHKVFYDQIANCIDNQSVLELLRDILKHEQVDVSYMSDEEYANCMQDVFNSFAYAKIPQDLLTGTKYMAKHLNIGNQVAQNAGISYPIRLDNYIKIVRSVKYYGRYMDDCYILYPTKEYLVTLLNDIVVVAKEIGITINLNKTRICKLSSRWRFLQILYSLTPTGHVIKKINPKNLTRMRRRMKKLVYGGKLTPIGLENYYKSWFRNYYKLMSKQQREHMDALYNKCMEDLVNV